MVSCYIFDYKQVCTYSYVSIDLFTVFVYKLTSNIFSPFLYGNVCESVLYYDSKITTAGSLYKEKKFI